MKNTDHVEEILLRAKMLSRNRDLHGVIETLTSLQRSSLVRDMEACLLLASSWNLLFMHGSAKDLLVEIWDRVSASGDASLIRRWKNLYAAQFLAEGQLEQAEELFTACLASAERDRHQRVISGASTNLGIVASMRGEIDAALGFYQRAIAAAMQRGAHGDVARVHHNTGIALREWGRGADAFPHFMHAADYYAEHGVSEERVFTAAERAILMLEFGDATMAEHLARTAVERCSSFSNSVIEIIASRSLGIVLRDLGRRDEARIYLTHVLRLSKTTVHRILRADAHEEMAILDALDGNRSIAEIHKQTALDVFASMGLTRHRDRFLERFNNATAPSTAPGRN